VRVAHEWLGNALKHGMRGREAGRIEVLVRSKAQSTVLEVRDDGRCYDGTPAPGEGTALVGALASAACGTARVARAEHGTAGTLTLPHPARVQPAGLLARGMRREAGGAARMLCTPLGWIAIALWALFPGLHLFGDRLPWLAGHLLSRPGDKRAEPMPEIRPLPTSFWPGAAPPGVESRSRDPGRVAA